MAVLTDRVIKVCLAFYVNICSESNVEVTVIFFKGFLFVSVKMHLLPHNYVCKYDSLLLTSFGGFLVGLGFFLASFTCLALLQSLCCLR